MRRTLLLGLIGSLAVTGCDGSTEETDAGTDAGGTSTTDAGGTEEDSGAPLVDAGPGETDAGFDAGPVPAIAVTVDATASWVAPRDSVDVPVTIERLNGLTGGVTVRLQAPPSWASASDRLVPTDATSTVLAIAIAPDAPRGPQSLTIEAVSVDTPSIVGTATVNLDIPNAGDLDLRYGIDGVALQPIESGTLVVESARRLADGRLVAVGYRSSYGPAFIAVLRADGTADTSFSGNGFDVFGGSSPSGIYTQAHAVETQGTRFLVGYTEIDSGSRSANNIFAYDRTGAVVPISGSVTEVIGDTCCSVNEIAGRTAGFVMLDTRVRAFTSTGAVDNSFGTSGEYFRVSHFLQAGVEVDSSDRVYVADLFSTPTPRVSSIIRLSATGVLDTAFESAFTGTLPTSSYTGGGQFADLAVRADGSGAAVGSSYNTSPSSFYEGQLVVFAADGSPAIAGDGIISMSTAGEQSGGSTVALLPDGGYFVHGYRQPATERVILLQRYDATGARTLDLELATGETTFARYNEITDVIASPDGDWVLLVGHNMNRLVVERRIL